MDKWECPPNCEDCLLPGLEFHGFCQKGVPGFALEPEGQKKLFLDTGDEGLLVEAQAFFLWEGIILPASLYWSIRLLKRGVCLTQIFR